MKDCHCSAAHERRRIVLTGGPGAGKTALLTLIHQYFCRHVHVLPEAAGVIFGGGFPRGPGVVLRSAAQRAIFYVQRELEAAADAGDGSIVLCDRGTVDGVAYWPGPEDFWQVVGTTLDQQLQRYEAVIHLRTPVAGYNHDNPLRIESALEAAAIDDRILRAWQGHPRRVIVDAAPDFLAKAAAALEALREELPECCRKHIIPPLAKWMPSKGGHAQRDS